MRGRLAKVLDRYLQRPKSLRWSKFALKGGTVDGDAASALGCESCDCELQESKAERVGFVSRTEGTSGTRE